MKTSSTLPLLLAVIMLPSCTALTDARRGLNEMTLPQYEGLKAKVMAITAITSSRLAKDWDDARRAKALDIIGKARIMIGSNLSASVQGLDITGVIRTFADLYSDNMGLDAQAASDIKNAALLVDALIGPIKVGIDGKLGEREAGLVLALIDGLENGLDR